MLKRAKTCLAMSVMILCLASVSLAGHTRPGGEECTCGCIGCFCDPGEVPLCDGPNMASNDGLSGINGNKLPVSPESSGDGGAVLFGSLVFMLMARMLWR